jgi:hypothetical protein
MGSLLELCVAASISAFSLPSIPTWLGIQYTVALVPVLFSPKAACMIELKICCFSLPGELRAWMIDFQSVKKIISLIVLFCRINSMALRMPCPWL